MKDFTNGFYYSASQFFKEKFGVKIYKLSLDAGCTCPNRDGTKGTGGCIFCSENGSGDFASSRKLSIEDQLEQAKKLVEKKNKNGKYLAYFQNFTNTYGNIEELCKKYSLALIDPDVKGLVIGTRPDCINEEILEKIKSVTIDKFLSIELGLQTSCESTGKYINRCFSNDDYVKAVDLIHKILPDCHVVTHLILGLPGETEKDMRVSIRFAVKSGTDGLKLALLHVMKNTRLFDEYKKGTFCCYEKEEYIKLLGKLIQLIPENIVLHRLTGDGPKAILVSPLWTAQKKDVLNSITKYFSSNSIRQGKSL